MGKEPELEKNFLYSFFFLVVFSFSCLETVDDIAERRGVLAEVASDR